MSPAAQQENYNGFMRWFAEVFPELYEKYAQQIGVPMGEQGEVWIRRLGIEVVTYHILAEVVRQYYDRDSRSMNFRNLY